MKPVNSAWDATNAFRPCLDAKDAGANLFVEVFELNKRPPTACGASGKKRALHKYPAAWPTLENQSFACSYSKLIAFFKTQSNPVESNPCVFHFATDWLPCGPKSDFEASALFQDFCRFCLFEKAQR